MPQLRDDSLMERFDQHGLRRFRARDAVLAVLVTAGLLIVFKGASVRAAGEEMNPGLGRDVVLAFGKPLGWVADQLPRAKVADDATAWLSPDEGLGSEGSFATLAVTDTSRVPLVTPDAFEPAQLGQKAPRPRPMKTLLVTGDSMSTPLDTSL